VPRFSSIDQIGRKVDFPEEIKRIVSVVPSQTELLADLGLEEEVVGITKFCIHPDKWFRNKKRVGGTKNLNLEIIRSLKPDLILANKEENSRDQMEELQNEFPVWISDIKTLEDALMMIQSVGVLTNRVQNATELVQDIKSNFTNLAVSVNLKKALYFIWHEPMMIAGSDTFISYMMKYAGFKNAAHSHQRYPELTKDEINAMQPQYILLSSEPFPYRENHLEEYSTLFPQSEIILVDGEFFSWYGSRLKDAPDYFHKLSRLVSH
jgi:ABC-type Fe3+-hydroxamate transport system substrate-binding protein